MGLLSRLLGIEAKSAPRPHPRSAPESPGREKAPNKLIFELKVGSLVVPPTPPAATMRHWSASRAHQLFLTKIWSATDISAMVPTWQPALGQSPFDTVEALMDEGLVEPSGLPAAIEMLHTQVQLKALLKARGLKVSGKKEELAARLVSADPNGMLARLGGKSFVSLTKKGQELADRFRIEFKEERALAETTSLEKFKSGAYEDACKTMVAYEAKQVFPRGLGIDWKKYNASNEKAALEYLAAARPGILVGLDDSTLNALRLDAAGSVLFGVRSKELSFKGDLPEEFRLDAVTAARMFHFFASGHARLDQFRRAGVRKVRILAAQDSCSHCKAFEGRIYLIDQCPELPHPGCTHEMGCRCMALAEMERE